MKSNPVVGSWRRQNNIGQTIKEGFKLIDMIYIGHYDVIWLTWLG